MRFTLLLAVQVGLVLVHGLHIQDHQEFRSVNSQPASLFLREGSAASGAACTTSADCLSNYCQFGYCGPADTGRGCQVDGDCPEGTCQRGTCWFRDDNQACATNAQCLSGICTDDPRGGASKVCSAGKPKGSLCVQNLDCLSQRCINQDPSTGSGECDGSQLGEACSGDYTECSTAAANCISNRCRVPSGATCEYRQQCESSGCYNGLCGLPAGSACAPNFECFSSLCHDGTCDKTAEGGACSDLAGSECISGMCSASESTCTRTGITQCCTTFDNGAPTSSSKSSTTRTTAKPTSTITTTTSKRTTTSTSTSSTTSARPLASGATCSQNARCGTGYCRKALQGDGVTRSTTGPCDAKKATNGSRCYQNGGCISGTCNKNTKTCA
ncbi:hypothetical protein V8E36_007747 [Tilletia maclaganii]